MLLIHYKYIFIKDGLEKVDIRANRIYSNNSLLYKFIDLPKDTKITFSKVSSPFVNAKISLECFQKELDKDILSLIKQQEFKFSAPQNVIHSPLEVFKGNVFYYNNKYYNLDSFKIIDNPEKIAIKDGYIYNGFQCIQKIEYLGKKNLIIGSKKDIVFLPEQKRKFVIYDSACKELKNIKWDFILVINQPCGIIADFKYVKYALLSEQITEKNYLEVFKKFNSNVNLDNRQNLINLSNKIISYDRSVNSKNLKLTKYEKDWIIGIPKNKLDLFYSFPGNIILNKKITKKTFKKKFGKNIKCSICLDNIIPRDVVITSCGHTFCSSCLKTNLKITNKCPLCRKKIQKNSLTFVSNLKTKYKNEKIDYILSKIKKNICVVSGYSSTLNQLKTFIGEETSLFLFNQLNKNIVDTFDEIILMDKNSTIFPALIENPKVTFLNYN